MPPKAKLLQTVPRFLLVEVDKRLLLAPVFQRHPIGAGHKAKGLLQEVEVVRELGIQFRSIEEILAEPQRMETMLGDSTLSASAMPKSSGSLPVPIFSRCSSSFLTLG